MATSLSELLEYIHLESTQPPEERFAWLHRRSQHAQHPLVQFDFSRTHCTLRIVPNRRTKRKKVDAPHGQQSTSSEKTSPSGSSEKVATTGNSDKASTSSSSSEGEESHDPIFLKLAWQEVLGAHLQTADAQPLCRRSIVPRRVYILALYACPPDQTYHHHLHLHHKDNLPTERHLREWTFRFFGDEIERVTQLHHALNRFADPRREVPEDMKHLAFMNPEDNLSGSLRKFRVLVDPNEGLRKYEQFVAPMFRVANIETTVEITADSQRLREIATELPLDRFECVVATGGDSYLHEFIQGLMARPDWKKAIRQPLGILPADKMSSNGLAASIASQSHECLDLENAAFTLVKGRPQDLDLTSVCNGTETRYSFLKLEWALSEEEDQAAVPAHLASRVLVDLHLAKSVGQHVARTPTYLGKIWYLRHDSDDAQPPQYFQQESDEEESDQLPGQELFSSDLGRGKWVELHGPFRSAWINNTSHATPSAFVAPSAQLGDGYTYITVIDGTHPRSEVWRMLFSLESGKHLDRSAVQQIGTRALKLQPAHDSDRLCVDGHLMSGPSLVAQVHRGLAQIVVLPCQR